MSAPFASVASTLAAEAAVAQRPPLGEEAVRGAHPDRVRACLDPGLGAATVRRLQACARLNARLGALLVQRFGELAADTATVDAAAPEETAALLGTVLARTDASEAARLAGAVWHARSLQRLVAGSAVASLVARIGRRAHGCGLRHLAAAVETAVIAEPDRLAAAIERDGQMCLMAATAGRPELRLRVLVGLQPGAAAEAGEPEGAHRAHAAAVLACVAADLDEPRHDP